MNDDVSEIKSKLNIVDILGDYMLLTKAGANWKAACPFHNEKTPSFMVNEEKQFWHCFGCQKHGDIFTFIMEMEGLDFREALKALAEKAGVELKNYNPEKTKEKNRTYEILELATKWYEYQLWSGPGKTKALSYLRERGLKDETIKDFRLGYAPKGWRNILSFLLSRGYKGDEILRAGLIIQRTANNEQRTMNERTIDRCSLFIDHCYDRFRERIMFPVADYSGRVVGYSARVTPGQDETQAKYINTPETEVYHKSQILYGLDKARGEIKNKEHAVIVEGNMDVIASHQAGIKNTIAVSGTALTSDQVRLMKRYAPKVKMLFDMDAAGQVAAKKSFKICSGEDMQVEIVGLPFGKDAADVVRKNPADLISAIDHSENAMEYFLKKELEGKDPGRVEDKRRASETMMDLVANVENAVEKSHWIKKIAQALETTEAALTDILKKASLRSRIVERDRMEKKEETLSQRTKAGTLVDELIGLVLASQVVRKKAKDDADEVRILGKDSLLDAILEHDDETNFDLEDFTRSLASENERRRSQNLYLQKKFRLDLNNNLEEIEIPDPLGEYDAIIRELKRENWKTELMRLSRDMRLAEEKKDQDVLHFLRAQSNKISKNLSELNNQ